MCTDLRDRITLVIPTCDRPQYLYRLLRYYEAAGFPIGIVVLDSSLPAKADEALLRLLNHHRVCYRQFDHDVHVWSKVMAGMRVVSTPYCVLCGDDDFLTINGIVKSARFLDEHPDYSAAHGYHIAFRIGFQLEGMPSFAWWTADHPEESNESPDPAERLKFHFLHYQPTFYAVHRTVLAKKIFEANAAIGNDLIFGELLPSMLTAVHGKIKVLDLLYQAREAPPSTRRPRPTLTDAIREGTYDGRYAKFRSCLVNELRGVAGMNLIRAGHVVDEAMFLYYSRFYLGNRAMNRFFDTVWIPWFDFCNAVSLPCSEYHNEFTHVREHVEACGPFSDEPLKADGLVTRG